MDKNRIKNFISDNKNGLIIVGAAVVLTIALMIARAAGPLAQFETESANLSGSATVKSATAASGGKYVEFSAANTGPQPGAPGIYLGPSDWPTSGWPARPTPTLRITGGDIRSQVANAPSNAVIHIDINGTITGVKDLPVKAGQIIYGNGPQATVFDGQHNLTHLIAIKVSNLKLYDFGFKRYTGYEDGTTKQSHGSIMGLTGASNIRIDNVNAWENHYAGIRLQGKNWHLTRYRAWHNGQYGYCGSPTDSIIEYWETFENGTDDLPSGVPRYSKSDRGTGKLSFSNNTIVRYGYAHDDDRGIWFDIANKNFEVAYNRVENIFRQGIDIEASFGPGRVHHNEAWNNAVSQPSASWWKDWMPVYAQIIISTSTNVEVDNNNIKGKYGIGGYSWNHPQYANNQAGCLTGMNVHHNTFNTTVVNTGIAQLSSPCPDVYDDPSLNMWSNNTYNGIKTFGWDGAKRDLSYWNNLGFN